MAPLGYSVLNLIRHSNEEERHAKCQMPNLCFKDFSHAKWYSDAATDILVDILDSFHHVFTSPNVLTDQALLLFTASNGFSISINTS